MEETLADLVARSRNGDERAWGALWVTLVPWIERVARRGTVTGRLAACPDAPHDIAVCVMESLRADGAWRLAELGQLLQYRDGSWRRWLSRVARNAAVSYVRAHPEYLGNGAEGARRWVDKVPLSEAPDRGHAPVMRLAEAHRILELARRTLAPAQATALDLWLQGHDFAEIAAALACKGGAEEATRLVHSALERLRRAVFKKIDRCA